MRRWLIEFYLCLEGILLQTRIIVKTQLPIIGKTNIGKLLPIQLKIVHTKLHFSPLWNERGEFRIGKVNLAILSILVPVPFIFPINVFTSNHLVSKIKQKDSPKLCINQCKKNRWQLALITRSCIQTLLTSLVMA